MASGKTIYIILDEGGCPTEYGYTDPALADRHAEATGDQVVSITLHESIPDEILEIEAEIWYRRHFW